MADPSFTLTPYEFSGRKLGKYEILSRLSTGGMSEIFLAFQRGLAGFRKFVVLKQILPDIKGEEEFVRMFLDEAKITGAFTHPNIAYVYDLDIADGELFLAMEFVPGATLVEVARACRTNGEPIPIGFTLQAVRDTALALHYAHTFVDPMGKAKEVIHRDVAEKNIMVTYEGVTKLLDFGIAKARNRASHTMVGMVKGTSGYMSPEQILGEPLDPRSDVFSLGVVLHECLTGMRLFHGKLPEDGMLQALKGDVAPPSAQNRAVSSELDAVTLKALRRNRGDRYGTALEFARAIERAAPGSLWHPEQSAELIQRLFARRREETHQLMLSAQGTDYTGEVRLAEFLGNEVLMLPPPSPPPLITAAVPAPLPRVSDPEKTEIEPMQQPLTYGNQRTATAVKPPPSAPPPPPLTALLMQAPFTFRDEPEARTVPANPVAPESFQTDSQVKTVELRIDREDTQPVSLSPPPVEDPKPEPEPEKGSGVLMGLAVAILAVGLLTAALILAN
ncbi:MAG: serine/threonine-protein kinase [Myxococcaceae bacterium]